MLLEIFFPHPEGKGGTQSPCIEHRSLETAKAVLEKKITPGEREIQTEGEGGLEEKIHQEEEIPTEGEDAPERE